MSALGSQTSERRSREGRRAAIAEEGGFGRGVSPRPFPLGEESGERAVPPSQKSFDFLNKNGAFW